MYLTFVDLFLIVACVNEFAVLNVFIGEQPFWYRLTFPYFIHPLKVRGRKDLYPSEHAHMMSMGKQKDPKYLYTMQRTKNDLRPRLG